MLPSKINTRILSLDPGLSESPKTKPLKKYYEKAHSPFMLKMYNASRLIKILNVQEMSFIVRLVAVAFL